MEETITRDYSTLISLFYVSFIYLTYAAWVIIFGTIIIGLIRFIISAGIDFHRYNFNPRYRDNVFSDTSDRVYPLVYIAFALALFIVFALGTVALFGWITLGVTFTFSALVMVYKWFKKNRQNKQQGSAH